MGQYFAIPRPLLLLRHVFIYVSGRNGYYTEVYGILVKGKKRFVFQKNSLIKICRNLHLVIFSGYSFARIIIFCIFAPKKGVFKQ